MTIVRFVDGSLELSGAEEIESRLQFEIPTDEDERVIEVKIVYTGRQREGDPQRIYWTATVVSP